MASVIFININAELSFDQTEKEFYAICGKSGSVLRGMYPHGVTYALKFLVEQDGHVVFSFQDKYIANVLCCDFAPQVAKYIENRKPGHLTYPQGGLL